MSVTGGEISYASCGRLYTNIREPFDYQASWPQKTYLTVTMPTTPVCCTDDCHVFACEHASVCKCGKCRRDVPVKACGTCGKAL